MIAILGDASEGKAEVLAQLVTFLCAPESVQSSPSGSAAAAYEEFRAGVQAALGVIDAVYLANATEDGSQLVRLRFPLDAQGRLCGLEASIVQGDPFLSVRPRPGRPGLSLLHQVSPRAYK